MKKISATIAALSAAVALQAQTLQGPWNGRIELGQHSLPLVMHITSHNGENLCTIDSPDQGAKDIQAVVDYLHNDSIALQVPVIQAAYQGKLQDGLLKGTFTQAGMKFTLNLKPGEYIRERKQTPKTPYPYPVEEVEFVNPTDQARLSGTLTHPLTFGWNKKAPVVLMVTGSGQQNRDEELLGHKPFAVIADFLAKMGIASLRYDDRGFGQSTGSLEGATTRTFQSDAQAGIDFLKADQRFGKVGILGHSEGGLIGYMCAADSSNSRPDFVVSLAGPAVSGYDILIGQNRALLGALPNTLLYADDYCTLLGKVLQHLIDGKSIQDPSAVVQQYRSETGANLPEPALQNLAAVLQSSTPWLKFFLAYNPQEALAHINCPVMAVNGEKDTQVDARINTESLRTHLNPNAAHLIKTYPQLNHLFQTCTTGQVAEYGQIEETISPEVLKEIANWILSLK